MGFLPSVEEVSLSPSTPPAPEQPAPSLALGQEDSSQITQDKRAFEAIQQQEAQEHFLGTRAAEAPDVQVQTQAEAQPAAAPVVQAAVQDKDEVTKKIETLLEEGMKEVFQDMPPEAQARFQKKGEEVAEEIGVMVKGFKVKVKLVLELVRSWFLTIPGVNKYFLEQEAKIKTDSVLSYAKDYRQSKENAV